MMTVEAQETTWEETDDRVEVQETTWEETDDDSGSTRDYMEGRHR